jgi:hypothetical protein
MPDRPRLLGLRLAALAGAIHVALDLVTSRFVATSPPHLLLDYAGELFRELLSVDRTSVLIAMSLGAALANGAIGGLFGLAFEGVARRRRALLAWSLFALWIFSGGLLIAVYLDPPWGVVLGSLASGLPRAWLVAWALDRVLPPAPAPDGGAAGGERA